MNRSQKSSVIVIVLVVVALVAIIGFAAWRVLGMQDDMKSENISAQQAGDQKQEQAPKEPQDLVWQRTENGWQSIQGAPECPEYPMMSSPVDLTTVTSVLYPGQSRGGNYKPHGGFRFDDNTDNTVKVTAPIDGYLVRGTRYLSEGEVQYTFDAMNNCGVMYRVGHLRELPDNLQQIANTWPEPTESSTTQSIQPAVLVKKGDLLATKVGIIASKNVFLDWGVYDYREVNTTSKLESYQQAHAQDKELSWHAVCWLREWLPAKDEATIMGLPAADPISGKSSDYCS